MHRFWKCDALRGFVVVDDDKNFVSGGAEASTKFNAVWHSDADGDMCFRRGFRKKLIHKIVVWEGAQKSEASLPYCSGDHCCVVIEPTVGVRGCTAIDEINMDVRRGWGKNFSPYIGFATRRSGEMTTVRRKAQGNLIVESVELIDMGPERFD